MTDQRERTAGEGSEDRSEAPPDATGIPKRAFDGDGDGGPTRTPTFEAPWQARAFALAVALTDEGGEDRDALPWKEFQRRLVDEIDEDGGEGEGEDAGGADAPDADEGAYYRRWLAALERLLVERGRLDPGELTDRVADFEAGDRSGHEFVEGDPRAHADDLPEGHAEGSGHSHDHDHSHGHDRSP